MLNQLLLTTNAAVLLVGCGTTQSQKSAEVKSAEPVFGVAQPANPIADCALFDAAKAGNIEAVKKHLNAAADVNAKDDNGRTLLHQAAFEGLEGRKEIAELLIVKGADVNAKEEDGYTPLDVAKRYPEIADLLRKHGAKTGEELKATGN